jgi:putative IMPACT (imprinted ancient) family translation regulator
MVENSHEIVVKPSVEDILRVDADDRREMSKLKSVSSDHKHERGSTFLAQAVKVTSIAEVRLAYKKTIMNPALHKASHNILAYNVGGELGWIDDGEHSAGRILAGWMNRSNIDNTCFIITRNFGGEHLGTKRFELMREVAKEAHEKLIAALR